MYFEGKTKTKLISEIWLWARARYLKMTVLLAENLAREYVREWELRFTGLTQWLEAEYETIETRIKESHGPDEELRKISRNRMARSVDTRAGEVIRDYERAVSDGEDFGGINTRLEEDNSTETRSK